MCVVDKKQAHTMVLQQVASRDVLAISDEVDERQRVIVERADKSLRTAAMLNVRLAVRATGCQKRGIDGGEEGAKLVIDLRGEAAVSLDSAIGRTRSMLCLHALHRRRKGNITRKTFHGFNLERTAIQEKIAVRYGP
jgi:hypothetical protein